MDLFTAFFHAGGEQQVRRFFKRALALYPEDRKHHWYTVVLGNEHIHVLVNKQNQVVQALPASSYSSTWCAPDLKWVAE